MIIGYWLVVLGAVVFLGCLSWLEKASRYRS
jgi:hypothetical protein